ncbi:hypothetical protein [Microbacterium sp. Marseille-Q6965]|uniref:hypothetical protein n=1 Tax=Microbacterium sp. Marseille-Q6965 TaxID=2965072 RepID=UPI0021B80355|nr:hypothetical protein [Microbacterium sp. Marseille-Q6965]
MSLLDLVLGAVLVIVMATALVLVLVRRRRPTSGPLLAAAILIVLSLLVVAIVPLQVPVPLVAGLALLGTAVAVLGGDPVARRVLAFASDDGVREGPHGGILLRAPAGSGQGAPEVMRGGVTVGYLERLAAALALIVGYPEAIAVVVAIKGIARFTELASPEARERFIIGTLASLSWACLTAAAVRLVIA